MKSQKAAINYPDKDTGEETNRQTAGGQSENRKIQAIHDEQREF